MLYSSHCQERGHSMDEGIRKATRTDADRLIHHLVRAFDDDPMANYMLRQDARRDKGFNGFFRICLCTMSLPHDQVYTTEDCIGGALWHPPGTSHLPLISQLKLLPGIIRSVGFRGMGRAMDVFSVLDKVHPGEAHYYLQVLGVDPDHQGKGLGSALLRPVLERCDQEGCGAYLENSKEENTAFYTRHGFAVTDEIGFGPEGPRIWPMWRDPQ
jgi:ribosomal protein S18 acetylase RimI-like enzyme